MAKFIYTAKNYSGKTKGGEITAKDENSAARALRSDGFLVTSIKRVDKEQNRASIKFFDRFLKVPLKDKMIFTRNLSVMIASGLTLSRAINNLSVQIKNKRFKKILSKIHANLQEGKALSDGLAKYPAVFSDLFVNMVKVGETGGNLEEVLKILAVQLEKEHELLSKVRGAMIYPSVIVVAMVGIGILMLTYILPQITGVFADMEVTLPPATRFIMALSDFLKNHSLIAISFVICLPIFLKIFLQTVTGKKTLGFILINTPAIKNIVIKINCARFSRIYSSLLKSGVSVIEALEIVSGTLTNYYYKNALKNGIKQIKKGVDLSEIIAGYPKIFPTLVPQMLEVGEETGKTEVVLIKLAEFYEEEVNQLTKNLSSIIEPVLMLVIGGAVGFFAVAMLQPMYSVLENIN